MAEVVKLTEIRKEIFSSSHLEYEPERLANHNTRFSEHISAPGVDAGQTYQTVATITVTLGKILNIMHLRLAGYDADGNYVTDNRVLLEIRQAAAPVDADPNSGVVLFGLANGVVDVVVPGFYSGTLENPLAKLQGTVTFRLLNVSAAYEYVISMMGDEFASEPVEHYENLIAEH